MANEAVYKVITDRIVGLLEKGVVPWRRPWRTSERITLPLNAAGRPYRGINQLFLAAVAMSEGYQSNVWLTFKQATQVMGGKVKAGSRGYPVVFWKQLEVEGEAKDGSTETKKIPMLRYYTVFNLDQTTDVKLPAKVAELVEGGETAGEEHDPITEAEAIVAGMPNPPKVVERPSNKAFYSPARDEVTIPERSQFTGAAEYYSTLFHELVHSTGHESRLNRRGIEAASHFGDEAYSKEELVAEMGNAFLSAVAGIDPVTVENSAAYIASWKGVLKDDPKVVVQAAGQAQKAADFILNYQPDKAKED